jgi:hypothetical protein
LSSKSSQLASLRDNSLDGRKLSKKITAANIIVALPPGYRLIRINWKKGKIQMRSGFGNVKSLYLRGQR